MNELAVKESWSGSFSWLCEKWSDEACDFAKRRLEKEGISYIRDGYAVKPSRVRDRIASAIAGRDVCVPVIVPKFMPITRGISSAELRRIVGNPEEATEIQGNLLLNEGITKLFDVALAVATNQTAGNRWNAADSFIGVGDTATAEAATQTELMAAAAAANRFYKGMNATFPSGATVTRTWQSDFTTTEANFAWNEWTIASLATTASGAGFITGTTNLNRKVAALGTKTTGTWTLSGAVTLS